MMGMVPMPASPVLFEYPPRGGTPAPAPAVGEEHPALAHTCHAEGCPTEVPPEMLMCRKHWFMVPQGIRTRVWANYRAGQCDDRRPSGAWWIAAEEAVCHVAVREGRLTSDKANERIVHATEFAKSLNERNR